LPRRTGHPRNQEGAPENAPADNLIYVEEGKGIVGGARILPE
jgi:hypothetical protein